MLMTIDLLRDKLNAEDVWVEKAILVFEGGLKNGSIVPFSDKSVNPEEVKSLVDYCVSWVRSDKHLSPGHIKQLRSYLVFEPVLKFLFSHIEAKYGQADVNV